MYFICISHVFPMYFLKTCSIPHVFPMYFPCIYIYLFYIKSKGVSRQSPPRASKTKWLTVKATNDKGKPHVDAATNERGVVFAPRELVQIAPEHLALNTCEYIY